MKCSVDGCDRKSRCNGICDMHRQRKKDPELKKKWSREWVQRRRLEYFSDKSCEVCGTTENLEIWGRKGIDQPWSWSEKRRADHLQQTKVRCSDCREQFEKQRRATPEEVIARAIEEMRAGKPFNDIIKELPIDKKRLRPLANQHGIDVREPREANQSSVSRNLAKIIRSLEKMCDE